MPANINHNGPKFTTAKAGAIKNNGGTVIYGGNINTTLSNVTQSLGLSVVGYHSGVNGSITVGPFVPTAGTYGARSITSAITGRRYNGMAAGKYIMVRFTPEIAGTATTLLNTGAADFGRLPYPARVSNRIRTQRIIMNGGYYYYTGKTILGFGRNDFGDVLASEAFPTRTIPGRLVFATSGQRRTVQNYAAKTD
jgi:hypothetical protein